jgi:FkbM family methyltransferase
MPWPKVDFISKKGLPYPKIYIETGTFMGDGIREALCNMKFREIHSIELNFGYYLKACENFKNEPRVRCHYGDSSIILPQLLKHINEPIIIFLDAHYSGGDTSGSDETIPIFDELSVLNKRMYDDIIIIDDTRLFGKISVSGGNGIYKKETFNWCHVTKDKILTYLKPNSILIEDHSVLEGNVKFDQMLIIPSGKNINEYPIKYHVYTLLWNDEKLLKAMLKHYETAEKIVIYDCGSTDGGPELVKKYGRELRHIPITDRLDDSTNIKIKMECWKESKGQADFVIVQDLDEFVHFPKYPHDILSGLRYLKNNGINYMNVCAYTACGSTEKWNYAIEQIELIGQNAINNFTSGKRNDFFFPNQFMFDKMLLWNPNDFEHIEFCVGQHIYTLFPHKNIISKTQKDIVLIMHMKHLGFEKDLDRRLSSRERLKHQFDKGWGVHYNKSDKETYDKLKEIYSSPEIIDLTPIFYPNMFRLKPILDLPSFLTGILSDSDYISQCVKSNHTWEPKVSAIISYFCRRPNTLFIDIGSNIGLHSFNASISGAKKIVACECNPTVLSILNKNILANGWKNKFMIIKDAISDINGNHVTLSGNNSNVGGGSIHGNNSNCQFKYDVITTRLDDIEIDYLKIAENIVIKMDIEGNEGNALKGMTKLLDDKRLNAIIIELNPYSVQNIITDIMENIIIKLRDQYGFVNLYVCLSHPTDQWYGQSCDTCLSPDKLEKIDNLTYYKYILEKLQRGIILEILFMK